jgi:penicillin amidase
MPVEVTLKFTAHGPVLHEDTGRHRAFALRWVGSEPGAAGYLASLSVDRARNWKEFERALDRWKVPSLNFVYADVDGNIGWHVAGLAPVRKGWFGLLPVPGAEGLRMARLSRLPTAAFLQSDKSLSGQCKQQTHPARIQRAGLHFAAPFRYQRIVEVLGAGQSKYSIADFDAAA